MRFALLLVASLLLPCSLALAGDDGFGDAFYRGTGQLHDVKMVDTAACPGMEEYVKVKGHCPQHAAPPSSFGDEFYRRTGQLHADDDLVDSTNCPSEEEYVSTHGHCPQIR